MPSIFQSLAKMPVYLETVRKLEVLRYVLLRFEMMHAQQIGRSEKHWEKRSCPLRLLHLNAIPPAKQSNPATKHYLFYKLRFHFTHLHKILNSSNLNPNSNWIQFWGQSELATPLPNSTPNSKFWRLAPRPIRISNSTFKVAFGSGVAYHQCSHQFQFRNWNWNFLKNISSTF
jgi:hypothetical protein